jgi:phosphoenolpyruvate carboxylase
MRPHLSKEYMESSKPAAELVKLNPKSDYAPGLEDTLILTMHCIIGYIDNVKPILCFLEICTGIK